MGTKIIEMRIATEVHGKWTTNLMLAVLGKDILSHEGVVAETYQLWFIIMREDITWQPAHASQSSTEIREGRLERKAQII